MRKPLPDLAEICNILDQDDSQRQFNSVVSPNTFLVSQDPPSALAVDNNTPQQGTLNAFQRKTGPICSHCGNTGHVIDRCYKLHGYPVGWKKGGKWNNDKGSQSKPTAAVSAQVTTQDKPHSSPGLESLVGNLNKDQIQNFIAYFSSQLQVKPSDHTSSSSPVSQHQDHSGISFSSSTFSFVGILSVTQCTTDLHTWIVDSGATHHVCHDHTAFIAIDTSVQHLVNLPNGSTLKVSGIGQIVLCDALTLQNVLYIPEFRLNLLSVSSLTSDIGAEVLFDSGCFRIQDPIRGSMIGSGRRIANLYVLDVGSSRCPAQDSAPPFIHYVVDASVWHQRFGHSSFERLELLRDVLGFSKAKNKGLTHCDICQCAKQKKLSYTLHPKICSAPFELLHIDIWGPFSETTQDGHRYFLTIVDDHTRVTWVYLLKLKSDVLTVFPEFIQMVEKQYDAKIKSVRSDNAPELRFDALYKAKGIISYHSCPETPEQNSVVERKHQHILNVARALLFQSGVPLSHWGDCVLTAVFLINRTPSPVISNKTPFEKLTGKLPDYSNFKTFGCLCYASTSPKGRHKFQDRARACVFLGYPSGYKGYKLMDIQSHEVFISRNVVFYETLFPFLQPSQAAEYDEFFPHVPYTAGTTVPSAAPSGISVTSRRVSKPPQHLQDYHVYSADSSTEHPISNVISYASLSDPYMIFVNALNNILEPTSYAQACKIKEWLDAMDIEITALEENGTWIVCSLPAGKKAVGCKWVYKIKLNADGTLERYKARLVAKGYTQQEGLDYVETFSPVAKLATVKLLLAVAAAKGWSLSQLDISNAFLNGDLEEEIYMTLPPGYSGRQGESFPPNAVCKLKKSLYGLKQASRQWFLKFSKALHDLGFKTSSGDHTLFIKNSGSVYMAVLVYVDDIIIASSCDQAAELLKAALQASFKLRDLGTLRYFLGLEVARSSAGISICQRKYVLDLLTETALLGCKPSSIPMDPSVKLSIDVGELLEDAEQYRRLVGKLLYLTFTRPDITFAVHKLCQFTSTPRRPHLQAAYKILHYLKGTVGQGLFYSAVSDLKLSAFADADWGSCPDSRRSVTGYCMFVGSALIAWRSTKQDVVSHSSAESEYRAMSEADREMLWFRMMMEDLWIDVREAAPLYCDNTAAIHIANNSVFHERTKHMERDCHIVRERVKMGMIKTLHVRSEHQLADILTKPLFPSPFRHLLSKMEFINIYAPS